MKDSCSDDVQTVNELFRQALLAEGCFRSASVCNQTAPGTIRNGNSFRVASVCDQASLQTICKGNVFKLAPVCVQGHCQRLQEANLFWPAQVFKHAHLWRTSSGNCCSPAAASSETDFKGFGESFQTSSSHWSSLVAHGLRVNVFAMCLREHAPQTWHRALTDQMCPPSQLDLIRHVQELCWHHLEPKTKYSRGPIIWRTGAEISLWYQLRKEHGRWQVVTGGPRTMDENFRWPW